MNGNPRETTVITGGASGIGFACARALHAKGGEVILLGRRESALRDALDQLGARAHGFSVDINDPEGIRSSVDRIIDRHGSPTALVNNAGIHFKVPFLESDENELLSAFQTHVSGALSLTRALVPGMREHGGGSIVFISSMAALFGIPNVSSYAVAKSALTGAVRSLAVELGAAGIRVNAVAPGWIETAMSRKALESAPERKAKILSRTPLGRLGRPENVGETVSFLCSDAAEYITGTILPVDGGSSIGF